MLRFMKDSYAIIREEETDKQGKNIKINRSNKLFILQILIILPSIFQINNLLFWV